MDGHICMCMTLTNSILFLFICSWRAAGQKDDTAEEANINPPPPAHPDNLSFHYSEQAPRRCSGATKEFLNYKYIYINIPGLYSSNPSHLHPLPHSPHSPILIMTYLVFSYWV